MSAIRTNNYDAGYNVLVLIHKWDNHIRIYAHFQRLVMVEGADWNAERKIVAGNNDLWV